LWAGGGGSGSDISGGGGTKAGDGFDVGAKDGPGGGTGAGVVQVRGLLLVSILGLALPWSLRLDTSFLTPWADRWS